MDENGLIDSEYPASVSAGPNPLPRFTHPDHGELEIYGFDGRSKLCRDANGREFRIGTRVVNRLRSAATRTAPLPLGDQAVIGEVVSTVNVGMAERLPEVVKNLLGALEDGPTRVRIARDVWEAADGFLRS